MALGTSIVDLGVYKSDATLENDWFRGHKLVQDAIQDAASSIKTAGVQVGTTASEGVFMGGGSSSSKLTNSTTDQNSMEFRFDHTGASGDIRAMYLRGYYSGGCGGDCLRAFATVEAAANTIHGAHISLNFGSSPAKLTGQGIAMRGTLHIPDRAITLGTMSAVQGEVFMDGNSADPTATELSLFRGIVDGGDDTAKNKLTTVFDFDNLQSGVFDDQSSWTVSKVLKCTVNGTTYWLPLSTAK